MYDTQLKKHWPGQAVSLLFCTDQHHGLNNTTLFMLIALHMKLVYFIIVAQVQLHCLHTVGTRLCIGGEK